MDRVYVRRRQQPSIVKIAQERRRAEKVVDRVTTALWNGWKSDERPVMPSPYLLHDQKRQCLILRPGSFDLIEVVAMSRLFDCCVKWVDWGYSYSMSVCLSFLSFLSVCLSQSLSIFSGSRPETGAQNLACSRWTSEGVADLVLSRVSLRWAQRHLGTC